MNKALRYTLYALPVLATGITAYVMIRKYKVPAKQQLPPAKPPVKPAGTAAIASSFPLKKGSKNIYVTQLQQALIANFGPAALPRYGADGAWGSETETAMLRYTAKNQIASAAELEAVIDGMKALQQASIAVLTKLAQQLIRDSSPLMQKKYIVCLDSTPWEEAVPNGNGGWQSVGFIIGVHSGLKMSMADYKLKSIDPGTGFLIVECNRGGNAGYWKVNPDKIKLE